MQADEPESGVRVQMILLALHGEPTGLHDAVFIKVAVVAVVFFPGTRFRAIIINHAAFVDRVVMFTDSDGSKVLVAL